MTVFAYVVAMNAPANIFELAIQYALSGYAALSPLLIAALFWRRSTKWGALAVALWTAAAVAAIAVFQATRARARARPHGRGLAGGRPGRPDAHARRHDGARLHARGADGAGVGGADDRRLAAHAAVPPTRRSARYFTPK